MEKYSPKCLRDFCKCHNNIFYKYKSIVRNIEIIIQEQIWIDKSKKCKYSYQKINLEGGACSSVFKCIQVYQV